MYKLKVRN